MKRYWRWFGKWGVAALFCSGWVIMPLSDVLVILNYPRLADWWVAINASIADAILQNVSVEALFEARDNEARDNSRPESGPNVVPVFKGETGPH